MISDLNVLEEDFGQVEDEAKLPSVCTCELSDGQICLCEVLEGKTNLLIRKFGCQHIAKFFYWFQFSNIGGTYWEEDQHFVRDKGETLKQLVPFHFKRSSALLRELVDYV